MKYQLGLDIPYRETEKYPQFDQYICLVGIFLLGLDFLIYGLSFLYVVNRARKKIDMRKLGKLPMTMITFPNFYFFSGCIFRLIAYLSCEKNEKCWMYDRDQWSAYILPIIGICNAVLINIFMLRVAYVAAILKCQTKEEELKTEIRINIIRSFFLPAYFVLRCCIFVTEYAIFSSIDYDKTTMAVLIVLLNLLKECLTGTLGIIVLIFSCRI